MAYGIKIFNETGVVTLDSSTGVLLTRLVMTYHQVAWARSTTRQSVTFDAGAGNSFTNCGIAVCPRWPTTFIGSETPVEAFFSSGSTVTVRQLDDPVLADYPPTFACDILVFRYK